MCIRDRLEAELSELEPLEAEEFLSGLGLAEAGLGRLSRAGHHALRLQTFFTAGEKEVRAWTVAQGANAKDAAGAIHTDLHKHFIRAEVIHWDTLLAAGSEAVARSQGTLRLEGKEYIVKDGDVMHFRFNV